MHDHWTANSTLSMNQVVSDDALASCLASRSMGTHHVMWHIMWHVMWHDVRSGVVGPPARRHPLLPSFSLGKFHIQFTTKRHRTDRNQLLPPCWVARKLCVVAIFLAFGSSRLHLQHVHRCMYNRNLHHLRSCAQGYSQCMWTAQVMLPGREEDGNGQRRGDGGKRRG